MPGAVETVKLQVELFEKNAEARLKALDKLAREMGNRKITLNFDEASLERWKNATAGMTNAQINAYAKIVSAVEQTTQAEINAANRVQTEVVKAEAKKAVAVEQAEAKKVAAIEKTAQVTAAANAKEVAAKESAEAKKVAAIEKTKRAQERMNEFASSLTSHFSLQAIALSAIFSVVSKIKQAVREAINEMKEMDKELTTIKMVTGGSDSYISQMTKDAFAGARSTGRTTSDYLAAAERFARAGYRANIQELTQLSLVTQNVGGVTEDVASKFILAADAAWKYKGNAEELWQLLDGVTAIADQNATDLGKIAEAYTIAGSAFANAGETARTFAALIGTTTAATQRSGSEMARGLQTILFRVRQVKGELDDGEIIEAADISNAAKALDSVGISVLKMDGELKSFSDIMGELADKWETLDSKQKAYIQNALAGNRRGNVLFALMDNWGQYKAMLNEFDEATGTALEKNAIYTDSWAAATNNLSTAWTNLMSVMTNSGGIIHNATEYLTTALDEFLAVVAFLENPKGATSPEVLDSFLAEWREKKFKFWTLKGNDEMIDALLRAIAGGGNGTLTGGFKGSVDSATSSIKGYTDAADSATGSVTEAAEATKTWQEYLRDALEAGQIEIKTVNQITDAFDAASEAIKNASTAIKNEKDTDIKSISDIYKSMMEAAESGYYGSNAFRQGLSTFFSEKNAKAFLSWDNPYRDEKYKTILDNQSKWLGEYFDTAGSGDYAGAAFNLFAEKFQKGADGTLKIVNKAKEQLFRAVESDAGYEFTFNTAGKTMEQYLDQLSEATGYSKTFLTSVMESLGMYSGVMDQWEDQEEAEGYEVEIKTNSGEVIEGIDQIAQALADVTNKQYVIDIIQQVNTVSVGSSSSSFFEPSKVAMAAAEAAQIKGQSMTAYYKSRGYAGGKHDNYSGVALVNDEFPANGSKPELIISKSQGRAYIANGGRPALVNLASDDVVLTASETRSAMGGLSVPGFAQGKDNVFIVDPWGNQSLLKDINGPSALGQSLTIKTSKGSGTTNTNTGGGGGGAAESTPNAFDSWSTLKKLVDYLLDKANDDLKEQLKVLDDQLAELEAERKAQEESNKLQEKQEAVQQALLDLEKAQVERTVRYYNEETQQWEWMADQGSVQKAQEAYEEALKDLNEYLADQDYEARKAEIQARKDELQAQYDEYKDSWDAIVDAIEAPSGDIKAILAEIKKYGTSTMIGQSGGIAALLNALRGGIVSGGYLFGLGNINANTSGSSTNASTVFDSGGIAFGSGLMRKGAVGAEAVIGPDITSGILNPVRNANFSAFADSVRTLMGASDVIAAGAGSYNTYNNGGNIIVNGIKIGEDMMQKPFAEVMRTISLHVNEAV